MSEAPGVATTVGFPRIGPWGLEEYLEPTSVCEYHKRRWWYEMSTFPTSYRNSWTSSRPLWHAVKPRFLASVHSAPHFLWLPCGRPTLERRSRQSLSDSPGGIGCLNVGHRSPRVILACASISRSNLHLCFAGLHTKATSRWRKIKTLYPGKTRKHHRQHWRLKRWKRRQNARAYTKRTGCV